MSDKAKDSNVPKHIAIIPDGNRRWAKEKGLPPWEGHREGAKTFENLLKWCKETGIKELSFWGASTENLERDKTEVNFLLKLFAQMCDRLLKDSKNELKENKVRISFIGNLNKLTKSLRQKMEQIMEQTKDYPNYRLNLLIGYGGRWEIIEATKKIAQEAKEGKLKVEDITPEVFSKHLMLQSEPDLIIRTSEQRLSGLLPWQGIYAEIIFIKDKHWPEFTQADFKSCLEEFAKRQRRFGK